MWVNQTINLQSHNNSVLFVATQEKRKYMSTKKKENFTAVLFVTAKTCKQLKCPSTDEWINEMWSIHTTEYYMAIKRNEALIHATTWMNFGNIMFSERRQSQKTICYMIPFI